jgi:hypothetical protein
MLRRHKHYICGVLREGSYHQNGNDLLYLQGSSDTGQVKIEIYELAASITQHIVFQ